MKQKRAKPVLAWAIKYPNGKFVSRIYRTHRLAEWDSCPNETIVRVEIREVRRAKK